MSFSYQTKENICHLPIKKDCCAKAELAAIVHLCGVVGLSHGFKLTLTTEHPAVARRIYLLLKAVYACETDLRVIQQKRLHKTHRYAISIEDTELVRRILRETGVIEETNEGPSFLEHMPKEKSKACCKKSFLRGAFLGSGSIANPARMYHMEFVVHQEGFAKDLQGLLHHFHLRAGLVMRKQSYVVYMKESDHIVAFLGLIGANAALLNFEDVRVVKDMRNNINRAVNCETANLDKTMGAAQRQIQAIRIIAEQMGIHKLPPALREIAEARLNHPDVTLQELGLLLSKPLGKSGVNYRLRKLEEIAQNFILHKK